MSQKRRPNRRKFLTSASASAAALMAWSSRPALAANDTIRVAVIGTGSQGNSHVSRYAKMSGVDLVYVCDADTERREKTAKSGSAKPIDDLRRVLDDKTIDAVSIATPDHWHAPAAILACDAGKHVYVEKPCCHNFREGQLLVQAARRNNRVVQHGTQQRSTRFTADAIQMIKEGAIGEVLAAKAWNVQRRKDIGKASPSKPPSGFDYDMWVGPAPMIPFQTNRHHYNWHWWYAFGTGDLGNDGVHDLDYARWGLGVESLPARVLGLGGKYYFDDDQQFPDTQTVVFEYGDGVQERRKQLTFEMRLWSRNYPYNADSGAEFYGTKGKMMLSKRGKLEVYDDSNKRVINPKPKEPAALAVEDHHTDFIDAIRTNRRPNADIEIGFRSAALCNLGNLATRLGRTIELDPKTLNVKSDEEANNLLGRDYRAGGHWAIPKGATA